MEAHFWHEKWEKNEIGFHQGQANPMLVSHFLALKPVEPLRVFLPLCGKTRDIAWLLSKGHHVAGAELSELAIQQLFEDLGQEPDVSKLGELIHYQAPGIDIFVGDIFKLSADMVGKVDAVYDRAALVALPSDMRQRYADHLRSITGTAPQLLISFDYDQSQMNGPPFSVVEAEIRALYSEHYDIAALDSVDVVGGLKGQCKADETVWLLT